MAGPVDSRERTHSGTTAGRIVFAPVHADRTRRAGAEAAVERLGRAPSEAGAP